MQRLTSRERLAAIRVLDKTKAVIKLLGWARYDGQTKVGIGVCLTEAVGEAALMDMAGRRHALGAIGVALMNDCRRWKSIAEWNDLETRSVQDVYDLIAQAKAVMSRG